MINKNKFVKSQNTTVLMMGLLALTGCNQVGGFDFGTTGSVFSGKKAPAYEHTISEKVSLKDAFVKLPADAGEVIEVAQTRYSNGVEQLVIYQGDHATKGENAALVRMAVHVEGKKQTETLKINSVSAGRISGEIKDALPSVNMKISNELHTNAYGPFGYALGRTSGNVRCIYGWQQMKGSKSDRWSVFKRNSQKPKLSVRLRVCRSGVSNDQLVGLMRNLRIDADPASVLRPTAVSWDAGPTGRSTGALPDYERSGYVSQEREVYEEPDYKPAPQARVHKAKPRRVKKLRRAIPQETRAVSYAQPKPAFDTTRGPAYNPPLPGKTVSKVSRATVTTLVPVPPSEFEALPRVKPIAETPLVTARTHKPRFTLPTASVTKTPITTSGKHSTVPLPN